VGVAGPLCVLFHAAIEPRASDAEVAWYRERLPRESGPCLELLCGYGRLLVALAETGVNVHGVDVSAAMLAECEARLAAVSLSAPLFRQDAAELNLPFRYATAYVAADALGALSDVAQVRAVLSRIRAHLIDPARLFLDFAVPAESAQRIAALQVEVRTATLADGSHIALRSETTMSAEARIARIARRYVQRAGAALLAEEHETRTRTWYAPEDAAARVAEAGFRDVEVGPPARPAQDGAAFSISARASA
jgi:SAM-dependent methyltransferase